MAHESSPGPASASSPASFPSLDQLAFCFNRRDLLKTASSGLAMGILPFGLDDEPTSAELLKTLRTSRLPAITAIINAQIDSLFGGHRGDDPAQCAQEFIDYLSHLPLLLQRGASIAALWLDIYSRRHVGKSLGSLSPREVRRLLNQGEQPAGKNDPPLMIWSDDHLLHTAVSGLTMLSRLVLYSRPAAREWIGLGWSAACEKLENIVSVEPPPLADLDQHYDVCIIGSGAGGSTVAAIAAQAGLRVIIVEAGDFVSPDALIQRVPQADGSVRLQPPRCDEVLKRLYKDGAAQVAGGLRESDSKLELLIPSLRQRIVPKQTINITQARVLGGGPYVNNAIHLPIPRDVYESWGERQPAGVSYDDFAETMKSICASLGVNANVTHQMASERSVRFLEGCEKIGEEVQPLPVAMRDSCAGCGSDNSVDSFGDHVDGIHPYVPGGPNGCLMNALHAELPAAVTYKTTAHRIHIKHDASGCLTATKLDVTRCENNRTINKSITADKFVVAAGVGATTRLLAQSLATAGIQNRELGKRLTANDGSAVYAMFDKPIWPSAGARPEPGVTQCYLVDRRTMIQPDGTMAEEPALENWFHFPGTVALATTGWFEQSAHVMRHFNHLSMSGIVVPTEVRSCNYIDREGKYHLELSSLEFEMLLRGMRRIARIYLASAKPDDGVTLYLPTKAVLLRDCKPIAIRTMDDFEWALAEIRRRGPAFVNLLSTHPQGGAALGDVTSTTDFTLMSDSGNVTNLHIADAAVFPAGCEINPQLTVKGLANVAAHRLVEKRVPGISIPPLEKHTASVDNATFESASR
jgi:choline dehydrogenase-like flavoprotein